MVIRFLPTVSNDDCSQDPGDLILIKLICHGQAPHLVWVLGKKKSTTSQ